MTYRRLTVAETSKADNLSRRDFLKCRVSEGRRILELSCENLYMRFQDASTGAGQYHFSNHDDLTRPDEAVGRLDGRKIDELFTELERHLAEVDELHLLDREWLAGGDFGQEVGARIETFRQRGGRVELARRTAEPPTSDRAYGQ